MTYATAMRNKYSNVNTKREKIVTVINCKITRKEEKEFQGYKTFLKNFSKFLLDESIDN